MAQVRALVVDDEAVILSLVKMILEKHGYKVATARNGKKALELCLSGRRSFDFVVTDITMPVMDGRELARQLAAHQITIPVLFMSGYGSQEEEKILRKPFSPMTLMSAVETLLSESGAKSAR